MGKATILRFAPYADDVMNLPVKNLEEALPYYEKVFGFTVESRSETPHRSAVLERDGLQMGLAENGGDPTQEGAFIEVDDVEAAFEELKANGLGREEANYRVDQRGDRSFKVFFVVAPDELCYCVGQQVER